MLHAMIAGHSPERIDDIADATPEQMAAAVWIDAVAPTDAERLAVERATGLRVPTFAEMSEIESSSRLYQEDGAFYLSTPMAYRGPDGMESGPLSFVLTRERLLTVRFSGLPPVRDVTERLGLHSRGPDAMLTCGPSVFVGLMESITESIADVLERMSDSLNAISQRIFHTAYMPARNQRDDKMLHATLKEIGRAGDTISSERDTLLGLNRILQYVNEVGHDWIPVHMQTRMKALRRDLQSIADYDRQITDKTQFLLDATLGFISIAQNNGIRVLTVVTVIGVPPTFVASMYGMNFKNMPELDWSWGYQYGLAMIAISIILPLVWFWRRGWI